VRLDDRWRLDGRLFIANQFLRQPVRLDDRWRLSTSLLLDPQEPAFHDDQFLRRPAFPHGRHLLDRFCPKSVLP
jgi:hypothetical protein